MKKNFTAYAFDGTPNYWGSQIHIIVLDENNRFMMVKVGGKFRQTAKEYGESFLEDIRQTVAKVYNADIHELEIITTEEANQRMQERLLTRGRR